jgi:hypothetical protein
VWCAQTMRTALHNLGTQSTLQQAPHTLYNVPCVHVRVCVRVRVRVLAQQSCTTVPGATQHTD